MFVITEANNSCKISSDESKAVVFTKEFDVLCIDKASSVSFFGIFFSFS